MESVLGISHAHIRLVIGLAYWWSLTWLWHGMLVDWTIAIAHVLFTRIIIVHILEEGPHGQGDTFGEAGNARRYSWCRCSCFLTELSLRSCFLTELSLRLCCSHLLQDSWCSISEAFAQIENNCRVGMEFSHVMSQSVWSQCCYQANPSSAPSSAGWVCDGIGTGADLAE
jgi:hypothetical protein